MSEGTSVNTGVVRWPDPDSAYLAVRRMQIKLHRWAGEDTSRRFGDLFNLVYDPAFWCTRGNAWPAIKGRGPQESTRSRWPTSKPGLGSRRSWARSGTR